LAIGHVFLEPATAAVAEGEATPAPRREVGETAQAGLREVGIDRGVVHVASLLHEKSSLSVQGFVVRRLSTGLRRNYTDRQVCFQEAPGKQSSPGDGPHPWRDPRR
jgi:hypothetical protein